MRRITIITILSATICAAGCMAEVEPAYAPGTVFDGWGCQLVEDGTLLDCTEAWVVDPADDAGEPHEVAARPRDPRELQEYLDLDGVAPALIVDGEPVPPALVLFELAEEDEVNDTICADTMLGPDGTTLCFEGIEWTEGETPAAFTCTYGPCPTMSGKDPLPTR